MGTRKTVFAPGEYYHLYNRGNSKQKIFFDERDQERFLKLLYLANSTEKFHLSDLASPYESERDEKLVSIGAYCLMPNHFHLLVTPLKTDAAGENLSLFMKKLGTGYSMYFNTRYERVGSLFEGKFRSEHVDSDRYLKYSFSYIHLNPLKLVNAHWQTDKRRDSRKHWEYLRRYKYTSLTDYLDTKRIEGKILNKKEFPAYFSSPAKVKKEIFFWLDFEKD